MICSIWFIKFLAVWVFSWNAGLIACNRKIGSIWFVRHLKVLSFIIYKVIPPLVLGQLCYLKWFHARTNFMVLWTGSFQIIVWFHTSATIEGYTYQKTAMGHFPNIQYTIYNVKYTLQYIVYTIQYTLYPIHYTLYPKSAYRPLLDSLQSLKWA